MSAECEKCGTDLVGTQWEEGGLSCRPCDLERQLAEAQGKLDAVEKYVTEYSGLINPAKARVARILKGE